MLDIGSARVVIQGRVTIAGGNKGLFAAQLTVRLTGAWLLAFAGRAPAQVV